RGSFDEEERRSCYDRVQQILFDTGAYLPICTGTSYFAVKKGVSGIEYYPTAMHDFSYIVYQLTE
ncbi:MAG: hypothetical protein HUJ80_05205, partial [Firmicutes bacterium]|nr:hypothetical protein [Bacillota bacterium]